MWGGGLNLQMRDLNGPHETERTVFPILQVFSMCIVSFQHVYCAEIVSLKIAVTWAQTTTSTTQSSITNER